MKTSIEKCIQIQPEFIIIDTFTKKHHKDVSQDDGKTYKKLKYFIP